MPDPRLVPELYCTDIERSLRFYTEVLGFTVLFSRPEDHFAYLDKEGAHLMLEQPNDPQRIFLTADLTPPYGRGVNFQIEVADVDALYAKALAATPIFHAIEERWYRRDDVLLGNRQFWLQDPDGNLLRFFTDLGTKPATGT